MSTESPKRGATATPRSELAAASPHIATIGAPPNFIVVPQRISMWGNDVHGDCVTAEEAFAKACNNPEIFIPDNEVIAWATKHGVLEGAYLTQVMQWMQNDGFPEDPYVYDDGPYFSVKWTDSTILQNAIYSGPVKIGVAADQIETAWRSTGGQTGWFGVGWQHDANEDHCVSLCGYGTLSWLAQQLKVQVPSGIDGSKPGYAMFTWNTIGIVDVPSLLAVTQEAWVRQPTTVTKSTNVVGTWSGRVDWGPTGNFIAAGNWTFKSDGTWTYAYGGGRWIQIDDTVIWTFSNAPGLIYTGTVLAAGLKGVMGYTTAPPNPGKGRFTATRTAAIAELPGDPLIGPTQGPPTDAKA